MNYRASLRQRFVDPLFEEFSVHPLGLGGIDVITSYSIHYTKLYETVNLVLAVVLLGFPLALVFAWIFDISPEGIVRTEPLSPADHPNPEQYRAIAVLPFADMSENKDQSWFAEGIAEVV